MALYPISVKAPCLTYHLWDGVAPFIHYNDYLVTPPRVYDESLNSLGHFFYDPGTDKLVGFATFSIYHWPGWAVYRYEWDPVTGAFLGRSPASIFAMAWANHAGPGSYGAIYTTWRSCYAISEVKSSTLTHASGMWEINPWTWNPQRIFNFAVVNRENKIIAGVGSWYLETWDISGTPFLKGQLRLPQPLGYLAYEDRKHCWAITKNGLIAKANYQIPRWEMLSSVQDPSPDAVNYLCAFDTKRKRLAVFRQRPDAEDGACQCQLEFYYPLYRVAGLTEPVPVSRLRTGDLVRFVAHLYGDTGEGVASYLLHGELLEPATGQLLTPMSGAELCGGATFRYRAPGPGSDTLKISAVITDGEGA
ncbi:MAG: hypothetical protein C4567_03155 [Deltaproteobacteria bacterium]|nr:MAG: hypothetical protein C4567_03155 [Deltaproteobacteria bacterium]